MPCGITLSLLNGLIVVPVSLQAQGILTLALFKLFVIDLCL